MYKIGEFSKLAKVSIKSLHYYDQMGLFKPAEINEETGYRYYTVEQLDEIGKIVQLRSFGFSIQEIIQIFESPKDCLKIKEFMHNRKLQIENDISEWNSKLKQIDCYMRELETEITPVVTLKTVPQLLVASIRDKVYDFSSINDKVYRLKRYIAKEGIENAKNDICFTIYHDLDYKENDIDVEVCQSVIREGRQTDDISYNVLLEIPSVACIQHKGSYMTIRNSYKHLIEWIEQNGYQIEGTLRECYIDKCLSENHDSQLLTEIQAPVKKIGR